MAFLRGGRALAALAVVGSLLGSGETRRIRGPASDFSALTEIMVDMCGTDTFVLSYEYPCQFHVFGFSIMWLECSSAHETNLDGFRKCMLGCDRKDFCAKVCAERQNDETCAANCNKFENCLHTSLGSATGSVSAAGNTKACYKGELAFLSVPEGSPAAAWPENVTRPTAAIAQPPDIAEYMPNYIRLFPEECELIANRTHSTPIVLPEVTSINAPPRTNLTVDGLAFEAMAKSLANRSKWESQVKKGMFEPIKHPVGEGWHLEHANLFLGPQDLEDGPTLPPFLVDDRVRKGPSSEGGKRLRLKLPKRSDQALKQAEFYITSTQKPPVVTTPSPPLTGEQKKAAEQLERMGLMK